MTAVQKELFSMQDEAYKMFQAKLMPTIDVETVIGVRTPNLRKFAKAFAKTDEAATFLQSLPHRFYEENNLHAFLLEQIRDFDACIAALDAFLPYVDNWATCDSMNPRVFAKEADRLLPWIDRWLCAEQTYAVRFGIVMLMKHFLGERFDVSHLERVAAVREALPSMRIAVDFHGRVHKTMAKQLIHMLEPYNLMFVEEPVLCENEDEFLEFARTCHTPIATGERNFTRWGFKHMLTRGGVDIIQPDVSHCGGILEARKIAAMAEAFDVAVALHCPLGPIALAACLQVDFCTPNAFIQEQSAGIHYNDGYDLLNYISNPEVFTYKDGMCELLTKPGLGVEVNEAYVREMAAKGHDWHNPIWRDSDGVIAEW